MVNSFSKYFSMTGWRLGWLLVPPRLLRAVDCLAGNFTVCPPALPQLAALGAFTPESYAEADAHVTRYGINRDLLLDGLTRLGITRLAAEGLTNREIGEALFITLKTVETHLAHAYAKLGITSRGQLAAALGDRDVTDSA